MPQDDNTTANLDFDQIDYLVQDGNLQVLIEIAKGNRTSKEYSKASGVSEASLSKMMKGKYKPSPTTMRKLTSAKANPQGGIKYETLMQAAGYEVGAIDADSDAMSKNKSLAEVEIRNESEYEKRSLYESTCVSQIYISLAEKGVVFKKNERLEYSSFDLELDVIDQPITRWKFDIVYMSQRISFNMRNIYETIGRLASNRLESDVKVTIIINDSKCYKWLKEQDHSFAYRGELSVALFDIEKNKFVEETYLANYYEGDTSREVYLV
ncbi:MAG: helix-turn-helix transcriptional regulator [Clostridiales bacterium]|nr:helix-turn-helix transcriptional regulator [Clostridiales bacterium]